MSHIEINVSDYQTSLKFYDVLLPALGWRRLASNADCTTYSDGQMKIVFSPTGEKYLGAGFHRKRTGLNHLAFNVDSKAAVDRFVSQVVSVQGWNCLYEGHPTGDETYYAVCLEDPDRIKIEIVFAPGYCEDSHWTNQGVE